MPNASLVVLILGLVIILVLALGSLLGFLAGLKRELKCLTVFVVILGLFWVIFGGSASLDKNVMFGLSGIIKGSLGVPGELQTWREVSLYFGQIQLGLKEILVEGTQTYSLYMNVVSTIVRGLYLVLGTIFAFVLSGLVRFVSFIVRVILRSRRKDEKQDNDMAEETVVSISETEGTPKQKMIGSKSVMSRCLGAGVGFLKSILIVILICAPITGIVSIVDTVDDDTADAIEEITMGAQVEGSMIDWVFDVVHAMDDSLFVNMLQSSENIFGKSISLSIFDSAFRVETESDVLYVREELIKLIDIVDIVAPTFDASKQIPFDIWNLSSEELDALFDALAASRLVQAIIPVAFEYAGQMDAIQVWLKEAGLMNLNDFVKTVDWEHDLVPLLQTVKKALQVVNLNEGFDVLELNSDILRDLINTLGVTTFFQELMPIVVDIALSLAVVENFAGEIDDITGSTITFDWKDELINLVDIYEVIQGLNLDLNNLNLNTLVELVDDPESFAIIQQAIDKLTAGDLFMEVIVPILDQVVEHQLEVNNFNEFQGLLSLLKLESSDWSHDLPIVLEVLSSLNKIGLLSNQIKLDEYEAMHDIVDAIFDLVILSDKVKVSVDGVAFKTLVVEAAIRHFGFLDSDNNVFVELALRNDINWEQERTTIHNLVDTFEAFANTVEDVQGIEFNSLAVLSSLDFNLLLGSDSFWDNVLDLLDSVVDSKLVMSILPNVFEIYISPIIFNVNGELGEVGLFENITSENILAELYNIVYIALDLKGLGIFDANARATFDYEFNALAFTPEGGFFESESFTYKPNPNDLALADIIERIFASAIFKDREDRIFRILFALALGVNVSSEELASINYSTMGSINEKQVLIQGINKLRPILDDPAFSIFKQYIDEEGIIQTKFNIEYFLDVKKLDTLLGAVNVLTHSKLFTYLLPEVYNQLLIPNGIIPEGWGDILAVQSTYLGKTEGITAEELNEDVRSIIKIVREAVEFGLADFLIPEKARDIQIHGLGKLITNTIEAVIELNIIEGKLNEIVVRLLSNPALNIDRELIEDIDWDLELMTLGNIFKYVEELLCLSGLITYGDVLDFLGTVPMDISIFYHTMAMYDLGHIFLELYNSQILYKVIYEFVFNNMLAENTLFNDLINLEKYDVTCFKTDLIILADLTYHMIYSDFMSIIGCVMFPAKYDKVYRVNLANAHNAYILEDVLSLNVLNINLYKIVEFVFKTMGFKFSLVDLFGVRLSSEYQLGVPGLEDFECKDITAFTEFNNSFEDEDYSYVGDSVKVREMYLALIPFFKGSEFPIHNTEDLFGFMNAFMNPETIEAYKTSDHLNTYALSIADALDIFADMTIGRLSLVPIIDIIDKMGISFGTTKLSDLLDFDSEWSKTDMLNDIDTLADVIRNAVGFDLINIILRDAKINWTGEVQTESAQDLIKNVFSLNFLDARFETLFNLFVAPMFGDMKIELSTPVDLKADGEKIASAYPYIAAIMNDTIGLRHMSELSTLQIDLINFIQTDGALNAIYTVREVITISILESILPSVFEALDNMGFKEEIRPLFDLSDITAKGLLLAIEDLTYPLEDLVKLDTLKLLIGEDISLVGMDALPGIVERILHNAYIDYKYEAIISLVGEMLGLPEGTVITSDIVWDDEVSHITGAVQDLVDVIENCKFQTTKEIKDALIESNNFLAEYATVANIEELISAVRHLIASKTVEQLGLGFYEHVLLTSLQTSMDPIIYNLIKIDDFYTRADLLSDVETILQTVEVVIYGDIYYILVGDLEIEYVNITPDVQAILNNIFGMTYLNDKIVFIYDYIDLMGIDSRYVEFDSFDFINDGITFGKAYELMAPLLDSGFNPYQKLSDFNIPGLKFNLAQVEEADFVGAINGLKLVVDTTIIENNIPGIILMLQNSFSTLPDEGMGVVLKELVDLPLKNGEYKNTVKLLQDDINTILDSIILVTEGGLFKALRDTEGYNINETLVPSIVEAIKSMLNLRYLTELKGQGLLESVFEGLAIEERLDFETLTYVNEVSVLNNILDYIPDILNETGCMSIDDYIYLYNGILQGTIGIDLFITQENFTTLLNVLECLIDSEINRQVVIPYYQTYIYPAYEASGDELISNLFFIDETIYTNDSYINDYESIVNMLMSLDKAGIYGILFNNDIIDYDNVDTVEQVIRTILESNIFKYKEDLLVSTIIDSYAQVDANINLINKDIIKLSGDVDHFVNAYVELVPILMNPGFPYNRLSDFSEIVNIDPNDFINDQTGYLLIGALRELAEISLVEAVIPYVVNMGKLMLNNEYINELLSYQDRGLTDKDIVDDLRTLLSDKGVFETLVEIRMLDLMVGIDINIYNNDAYETIIRDLWDLNLLDGQYENIVRYLGSMFGFDFRDINDDIIDEANDKEVVISLVKSIVELLHNNGIDYTSSILTALQNPSSYISNENVKEIAGILKDVFDLTVLEEVLPRVINAYSTTYFTKEYRELFYINENYTYDNLKDDYVNILYNVICDLVDMGIIDIVYNDAIIPWEKVKEDGTTYYGSDIIKELFSLTYLNTHFEKIFNLMVAPMFGEQVTIELTTPVDLKADGVKIANAYPYIAAIMNDTIGLKQMSQLSTLVINPGNFLVTEAALNAIYAVREAATISILESVLPSIFAIYDNMGFKEEIRPLFDLSDITAKGLLLAVEDLTYPLEDLVKLDVLKLLQRQNISLEGIDALPGIVERILRNDYVEYKYETIISLLGVMMGFREGTIDPSIVVWEDEVTHITGAIQDIVEIIENCEFQTANDLIRLVNEPNTLMKYATEENLKELVSALRHLISSTIVEQMGLGFYEQVLLPALEPNLHSIIYNLIKIDEVYTGSELLDDLGTLLDVLEIIIDGDLYEIIFEDAEIDYVGITPDVQAILNSIFGMTYLNDKIVYIYDYIDLMGIDNRYVDFDAFNFVMDGITLGEAYEQIAPLLDSKFNPYQKLSTLTVPGLKFNFGGAKEEVFIDAINGLKLVVDTTIISNNIPGIILMIQNSFSTIADEGMGIVLKELVDLPLENGEYVNTTQILQEDIKTLFDVMIVSLEGGLFEALRDTEGYDVNQTLVPALTEALEMILNLRYLTELKGQDILEATFEMLAISDRLDYETLTYNNEVIVFSNIIDYIPDILAGTGCISYADYMNLYASFLQGTLNINKFITQENFTLALDVLECLIDSEINRQVVIPYYQTYIYPMFEASGNQGIMDLYYIDETIYTNDSYISDYEAIINMLMVLDDAGIYGIIYNDETINYDNVDAVEEVIRTILESNIFQYKEDLLVSTVIDTYAQLDANLTLIDKEVITLSEDVDYIVNTYKELVPVLMNPGFPYNKLSDLTTPATIDLSNFINDETAYAVIRALRELNETTLVEGSIPYILNMGKTMLNNEYVNELLSYEERGLTNKDIVDDFRTLLKDGGALETLIDIKILDLINGIDINIYNNDAYETIINDVWELNILEGQYTTIVKYLGNIFGFKFDGLDEIIVDEANDKEVVIKVVREAVELLHSNSLDYIIIIMNTLQDTTKWGEYITDNNILSLADIVKDVFDLTILEGVLPTVVNDLTNTLVVEDLRELFYIDRNYTYANLKDDYVNYLYDAIYDLVEIEISDIVLNDAIIPWDKVKEDGTTYYGSDILENIVGLQYLNSKKSVIYQLFIESIVPNINVHAFVIQEEANNFSSAYAKLVPFLTSSEWTYNTYSDLLSIVDNPINVEEILTKDNTQHVIDALREFNDSAMLEEIIGPFFESISDQLVSWFDFSKAVDANEELEEYDRLLNILELLNEMGYTDQEYEIIDASIVTELIDAIFGNETLETPVKGLTSIVDQGECILMLYSANLIPTLAGVSPDVESVEDNEWHHEILALRNIVEKLGALSSDNTIDMNTILEDITTSKDVENLEEIFTALNESKLYRNVLCRTMYNNISGTISKYTTSWFTSQRDNNMNDEWDEEVIVLARIVATVNSLGGFEAVNIDNYENLHKGYDGGDAATDATYSLVADDVNAGLRQLYQLLEASKTFDIAAIKEGIESTLGII